MKLSLQGRAHVKLDAKGRVHLPTRFRESLQKEKRLFITNSVHAGKRYLDIHSSGSWQKLIDQMARLPHLRADVQAFQRYYVSSGEAVELDGQGRFLIPGHFREFAALSDEIVLIGAGPKFEVWSDGNWNQLLTDLEGRFDSVMSSIADLTQPSANVQGNGQVNVKANVKRRRGKR